MVLSYLKEANNNQNINQLIHRITTIHYPFVIFYDISHYLYCNRDITHQDAIELSKSQVTSLRVILSPFLLSSCRIYTIFADIFVK